MIRRLLGRLSRLWGRLDGWADARIEREVSAALAKAHADDVHEITEAEAAQLEPADCYPDCSCMPAAKAQAWRADADRDRLFGVAIYPRNEMPS